ncbi:MAG: transcriptional regulator [Armatimonadota bacterium]|jgi:DNA-binding MarR family transcriptional regulator
MSELDPHVHQPTRLRILMLLSGIDTADFNFLLNTLSLTKGNLSSHIDRLEKAGYVEVSKAFVGKIPNTSYRLTNKGRSRLEAYWQAIDAIRASVSAQSAGSD